MERVLTARGAATRQRIVAAAAALIRERGVADTGLDDIGAATATSKSQLFHYFPGGKTDLLHAVAVHEAEQVIADQQPYLGDLTTWRKWQAWRRLVMQKYDAQQLREIAAQILWDRTGEHLDPAVLPERLIKRAS